MTNNAINSSIPIEVTKGGTQASSFVAYAPVVGGTTSTGALQSVASAGVAGQVLVSQGPSALPTWAASSGFTNVVVQTFTSSGTYTPTANMVKCIVEVLGGGAGGASANATPGGNGAAGGGGGSGEYRVSIFDAATIGASQTVTIGTGGASNTAGGNTSFGSLIVSNGGGAGDIGQEQQFLVENGGIGGTGGTGGNIIVNQGSQGFYGQVIQANPTSYLIVPGQGANAIYGSGGGITVNLEQNPGQRTGENATGYGAGGGAGSSFRGGSAANGGTGAPGIVIVTEFIA